MNSKNLRRYLLMGLVVWLPIIITIVVIRFIVDLLDMTLTFFPESYHPEKWIGFRIPGIGIIISLIVLLLTGMMVTNFLGQKFLAWGEAVVARIPLVRSIYLAAKQVIHSLFVGSDQSFRKVLLIEYPRTGVWSLGFLTSVDHHFAKKETTEEQLKSEEQTAIIDKVEEGEEKVCVFVPTTPNPTSGFLVILPKKDTVEISMSIEEALKFIISLGVMRNSTKTPSST